MKNDTSSKAAKYSSIQDLQKAAKKVNVFDEISKVDQDDAYGNYKPMF